MICFYLANLDSFIWTHLTILVFFFSLPWSFRRMVVNESSRIKYFMRFCGNNREGPKHFSGCPSTGREVCLFKMLVRASFLEDSDSVQLGWGHRNCVLNKASAVSLIQGKPGHMRNTDLNKA